MKPDLALAPRLEDAKIVALSYQIVRTADWLTKKINQKYGYDDDRDEPAVWWKVEELEQMSSEALRSSRNLTQI